MKIKKIGELPEEEIKKESSEIKSGFDDTKFNIPKSAIPLNKNYMIAGAAVFLILAAFVLYFFVIKDNTKEESLSSDKTTGLDEIRRKELELKERELKLKEKQLNQPPVTNSAQTSAGQSSFEVQASDKIREWVNSLGTGKLSNAYNMMSPKRRGDYSKFNSTKGYGGITSTAIYSCNTEWSSGCYAEVVAYYESIDPYNKSGKYKQKFSINNCSGNWQITEISNISIENY
ncbi:MAG: hypothetical protein JST15_12950 [Bacteroidetes bacterium]|nr:hypothetical protein [Bacteroidota bacterium]